MVRIEIMPPPPSLNQMLRMHWAKRSRINRRIYREVWASVLSQVKKADLPLFGGQQILVHLRRIGKRKIDQDNLVGSAKAVIDGLRKCGAIRDDTEEFVILGNVSQRVVKKGETPRLKVELERA